MATRARKLEVNDRDLVFQRIQYNAYFLHPENVLLSMIADENLIIRKLGWKRLKKATDQMIRIGGSTGIRCFDVPKVIFEANSYHEAIDWSIWQNDDNDNIIYPYPPMLRYLTHEEVEQWANKAAPEKFQIPDFLVILKLWNDISRWSLMHH